jgi:inosine-uridine nucleoside N-ribohydrolase
MLAAAHPAIDLLAVTTVSGNGPVSKVTDNARRVCTMAGLLDTIIAEGASGPLVGGAAAAPEIHGESALDGAAPSGTALGRSSALAWAQDVFGRIMIAAMTNAAARMPVAVRKALA